MDLLQKLNMLMKINNIKNLSQLSKLTKLPYTTLKSIFDGDVNDIRLSTSQKICDTFNITLDELLNDNINLKNINSITNTQQTMELLENYNKLNNLGKTKANENVKDLTKISEYTDKKTDVQNA